MFGGLANCLEQLKSAGLVATEIENIHIFAPTGNGVDQNKCKLAKLYLSRRSHCLFCISQEAA